MRSDALYIHVPFCVKKCSYCAFSSIPREAGAVQAYLCALAEEFSLRAARLVPRTLYVGGGTPTCMTMNELEIFFGIIRELDTSALEEFTFEANPGTLDMEKLMFLSANGVNRLSLGVQSFNDEFLRLLGRVHTAKAATAAFLQAREAGFDNVSIDLINSLPGQTPDMWLQDMEKAVKLGPEHMSCYGLTYEEGTPLYHLREKGGLCLPSEGDERIIFDITASFLERYGYERYEISSFRRQGFGSMHNLNYWRGGEYVGLGPAAHSFEGGRRLSNCADVGGYVKRIAEAGTARDWEEQLPPDRRARERAVIALRMAEGFEVAAFENETGFSVRELFGESLEKMLAGGWLEEKGGSVRLSGKAYPVADSVLAELV